MQILEQLKITQENSINIMTPELGEKYNYFLEPTSLINKYDQIIIEFQQSQNKVEIARNMLITLLEEMCDILAAVLAHKSFLVSHFVVGNVGYAYNNCVYEGEKGDGGAYFLSFPSALCGNKYYKVWIYEKNNIIYLEIAPLYLGLYKKENMLRDDKAFQEYMAHYKPLFFSEVSSEVVHEWLQKCEKVIRDIDSEYELTQH